MPECLECTTTKVQYKSLYLSVKGQSAVSRYWQDSFCLHNTDAFTDLDTDLDEITAVLRTRRLRWYGHVQRATSCINSITRLGLPGTRDRGRPRKTWSACVRNDMTICNLDGVNPLDRNSWRMSVRRCQVLPTPESGTTAAP